jgi:hypothetical protein
MTTTGNVISMEKTGTGDKPAVVGRWAMLQIVADVNKAMQSMIDRPSNLPGFGVLYGWTGLGKSMAASYCMHRYNAFLVEARSHHTRNSFVEAILFEMGMKPARTLSAMMDQVARQLDLSQRPLIVDEADYLIKKNVLDLLRDLHEAARTTILLVGEDQFPTRLLQRSERFHNRVLRWVPAVTPSLDDVRKLAGFYCDVPVADELLEYLRAECDNIVRYICVNLDKARELARQKGCKRIDRATWGNEPVYSAKAAMVLPPSTLRMRRPK